MEVFYDVLHRQGISPRSFSKFCALTATSLGLAPQVPVRYELLSSQLFASIEGAQDAATWWQWYCNHDRPNMTLNGFTFAQKFASFCLHPQNSNDPKNGGIANAILQRACAGKTLMGWIMPVMPHLPYS